VTSGADLLHEHTTAVSMLDLLLHHGVAVDADGESFRMKDARQRAAGVKSPLGAHPTQTRSKGCPPSATDDLSRTEETAIVTQRRLPEWVLLLANSVNRPGIGDCSNP
jgi:hypothetical protein